MSAVRGLVLADPQRLDAVRALAAMHDRRFEGITVRPFALKGGLDLCPPGAAFVASIESCPDAFLDIVFLDPLLGGGERSRLSRCLAPGAEIVASDMRPATRQYDFDDWVSTRGDYVARLLERGSNADSWIASTAIHDDLVLEAIDAHADRLFGQRRRKTLDLPGFAVPQESAWHALATPPEGALASLRPEPPAFWSRLFRRSPPAQPASAAATALANTLSEGMRLGRQIAASLPAASGAVRINIAADNDAPAFAMGLAEGLGKRDALVRVVDRSSARLGAFMLLYRELRFSCCGRVVFRWCPAPETMPPAECTITRVGKAWEINDTSVKS